MALNVLADGVLVPAEDGQNLLSACLAAGLDVPYFCWHPALGAVGSCRQCAVKVFDGPTDTTGRIVMACMTKPAPDMRLSITDPETAKFREAVIEMVLTNHPHDCPVCEVGGECHLQDMTVLTGHHARRHHFPKRTHKNQNLGPFIRHEMNRCIGCYRCVRFYRDYACGDDFGVFGAGRNIFFGRAADGVLESNFAGNLVEVCPTGVFVDKPFSTKFRRKWDLRATPSICPHCAVGCNITLQERGGTLRRTVNRFNATLNGYFLCDRGRFGTGFVNSAARLRTSRDRAGNALSQTAARERLASILRQDGVVGIGSPRASVEANFALRELVGAENFYAGFSAFDAAATRMALDIFRHIAPATLAEAEAADVCLILGDDPALVAPRLALALRQIGNVITGAPDTLLREIEGTAPAGPQAAALLAARNPVIVAGGDAALLATAGNLVCSLRRAAVAAQLILQLPKANSIGLALLDCRPLPAAIDRDVIVLERDLLRDPASTLILTNAKSITLLDHISTPTLLHADLAIAVASFAESDGIFVNMEGRAQVFFKAIFGTEDPPPTWQILRDAAIAAGRLQPGAWQNHAALLATLGTAVPALAPCAQAWPATDHVKATLPYRSSGRTAATAHLHVQEPLPPQHPDSPFGTTMEGEAMASTPGWNSVQATQKFFSPPGADVFLFTDTPFTAFEVPPAMPDHRILGREELSDLAPAIIARREAMG
jgi:NADH-quinone oxidoreductase subunit G